MGELDEVGQRGLAIDAYPCCLPRPLTGGCWPAGAGRGGAEPDAAPGGGGSGVGQRVAGAGRRVLRPEGQALPEPPPEF